MCNYSIVVGKIISPIEFKTKQDGGKFCVMEIETSNKFMKNGALQEYNDIIPAPFFNKDMVNDIGANYSQGDIVRVEGALGSNPSKNDPTKKFLNIRPSSIIMIQKVNVAQPLAQQPPTTTPTAEYVAPAPVSPMPSTPHQPTQQTDPYANAARQQSTTVPTDPLDVGDIPF